MTEQEKREKVIKGLSICLPETEADGEKTCKECPYWVCGDTVSIPIRLIEDIRALLEEQEPRVMTPEELIGSIILNRDRMVWFEFRDSVVPMNTKSLVYNDYIVDDDMPMLRDPNIVWRDGDGKKDGVIVTEYNDVFRCWTSRPTDEQREAVKWE